MKRTERHHLKENELVTSIEHASTWTREHQKTLVNGILVLAGAGLLLGGLYIYRTRQTEAAKALLSEALDQYRGIVGTEEPPEGESIPRFATAEEKYRAALASFEKVANEFSSYDPGRQAQYYVGLCQGELKDFAAAEASLQKLRSGNHDLLYYLSSKALAAVKTEQGDHAEAAEIFRPLVEDADNPLPKDYLLFELGRAEERAGNFEQARQYYDRMIAEHPNSQLRGDAMNRSGLLELKTETAPGG